MAVLPVMDYIGKPDFKYNLSISTDDTLYKSHYLELHDLGAVSPASGSVEIAPGTASW